MVAAAAFAILVCYALFNQPTEEDQIEPAAVASPRTPWSSRSANQSRKWTAYQASLVRDASAYQSGKSSRLVLMGDSITEAWVGTGYGSPTPKTNPHRIAPRRIANVGGGIRLVSNAVLKLRD